MTTTPTIHANERRKFPRYYVGNRMTLAIEDESVKESIGLGEPGDISVGGCRVRHLPACPSVKVGDRLGLLLLDQEDELSLHGHVLHVAAPVTFGGVFLNLTLSDEGAVVVIIERSHG